MSQIGEVKTKEIELKNLVKKNTVDGPFVCSWCGLEDKNLQTILDHENTEHRPKQTRCF